MVKFTPAVSHISRRPASPLLPQAESPRANRKPSLRSGENDSQALLNVGKPSAGTIPASLIINGFQQRVRVHAMLESSAFAIPTAV
jgi:hypothetical protein